MNKSKMTKPFSILLSIQMLAVPIILAYVCNIISSNAIGTGFPKFWSTKLQIIASITSLIVLLLPWPYKRWLQHDMKKRKIEIKDTHNFIVLIVGFALTTIPALIGFFLYMSGGKIITTYIFSTASFAVGTIWVIYSFSTYLKKAC